MDDLAQISSLAGQGVGRYGIEATIGRKLSADELLVYRRIVTQRKLRIAEKKARGPKSVAERVAEHVARHNDIGEFDARPRHRRLKESCRCDLARFMWYYCRAVVAHRPSEAIRNGLIHDVQETILYGGQSVKLYGRGTGKTTIIVYCAITWAILYGHRYFPVIISATAKQAKKNLKTIKRLISRTEAIRQDFPAIAVPVRALGDVAQRTSSQTYHGAATDIEWGNDQIVLPMCRDASGAPLDAGCGAIVGSVGIGGAVRGANEAGRRPDFLVLDDPQTRKIAHSPTMVKAVIDYIHKDALMLAGHSRKLSAFVTITPQCYGDVATKLASRAEHPEWDVTMEPFIVKTCPKWDQLVIEFVERYVTDAAAHDPHFTSSTEWYKANREKFAGVECLDPLQFDPKTEVDVVHHVLNLRAQLGAEAFDAEIMMKVGDSSSELEVSADLIASKVNGAPMNVLPPGTDQVVVFCDVNITRNTGLSYAAVAFGPHRVAAVVHYGRYPDRGALVPPNSSDLVRNRLLAAGMRKVVERVKAIRFRDAKNRKVNVTAMGFDRGYLPAVVHRVLFVLRKTTPLPFPVVAVRGFPWDKFGVREKDTLRRGDHVFVTRSQYGQYIAEMAPYWREIMQSGFLETPLQAGSISLFGTDPVRHFEFASEVANERLVRKYTALKGRQQLTAWEWQTLGPNHFCDCLTGCFALASWYHAFDNLSAVIDGVVVTKAGNVWPSVYNQAHGDEIRPHTVHQDDLFDPRINPAVAASAGYDGQADDTEGTGESVEQLPEEQDADADPLVEASRVRPVPARRKLSTKVHKSVYKFRRGRFRK